MAYISIFSAGKKTGIYKKTDYPTSLTLLSYYPTKIEKILETKKQHISPMIVGTRKETKVHLLLFVSFFIVRRVVPQGKCIKEKSIVQMAVFIVQPLLINNEYSSSILESSIKLPVQR